MLIPLILPILALFTLTNSLPSTPEPDYDPCDYDRLSPHYFFLSNVTYDSHLVYSTPSHLAVSYANVNFNLTNNIAYDAQCWGTSIGSGSSNYFLWPIVMECAAKPSATGEASFTYMYDGSFQVNETWTCGGHKYLGSGCANLTFECETTSWTNPNFTWPNNGDVYRRDDVTCVPVDVPIVLDITQVD